MNKHISPKLTFIIILAGLVVLMAGLSLPIKC